MQSWINKNDYPEKYNELKKYFVSGIDEIAFYYDEALKIADKHKFDVELIGNEKFSYNECIWPFERTYITWQGEMVPCCMRPDPIYSVGNVLNGNLHDAWHSEAMNIIRDKLKNNKPAKLCDDCPYRSNAKTIKKIKQKLTMSSDHKYEPVTINSF